MDRLEGRKEILLVESNIAQIRESIQYLAGNIEGILLSFLMLGSLFVLYLKSPLYDSRQKEKELIRENSRKMTANYESMVSEVRDNREAIDRLERQIEHLERNLEHLIEEQTEDIRRDIHEIKNLIEFLRAANQNRRMF